MEPSNADTLSLSRETPVKRKHEGARDDSDDGHMTAMGEDHPTTTAADPTATQPPATVRNDLTAVQTHDGPPSSTPESDADGCDGLDKSVGLDVEKGSKVGSASAVSSESRQQQGQSIGSKASGGKKGKGKQQKGKTSQSRGGGEQEAGGAAEVPAGREAAESGGVGSKDEYVKIAQYSTEREVITEVEEWQAVTISKSDKASQVQLSNDKLTMKSQKGYRMVSHLPTSPLKLTCAVK
eukprot:1178805-Prorocentrum_minimum.AAC.3